LSGLTTDHARVTAATVAHFHPLPGFVLLLVVAALLVVALGIEALDRLRARRGWRR
jgi:hypothetical protein